MAKNKKIHVQGSEITVFHAEKQDYISLTDIAKTKEGDGRAADIIKNWIRNRGTIEFIGTWEQLYNPNFKVVEFDHFRMNAGLTSFVLSPGKWVEKTDAIGIFVKGGRYGGTYAHLIQQDLPQGERLKLLNQTAIQQMRLLTEDNRIKKLEEGDR